MNKPTNTVRSALKARGYFGREDDMLLAWAKDHGSKSDNTHDALIELLHAHGATAESLAESWLDIYNALALTGTVDEMKEAFWTGQVPGYTTGPIIGWTGKEYCDHE